MRQGDPLSPILFNIVADMLTLFINRAKAEDQLSGVVPHLIEGWVIYIYYNTLMTQSSACSAGLKRLQLVTVGAYGL